MELPASSLQDLEPPSVDRSTTWGRRATLSLLLAFVVAGATGFLGVRESTEHTTAGGYTLELTYAQVARAGLDVPFEVTVRHPGGFAAPILLTVTGDYFDIFETQGFHPNPSAERRGSHTLYLEFDPPPDDTFVLSYDAYIQPSSQQGRDGHIGVVVDGREAAGLDFDTRLLP
ncbi:conserved hypothetical protein [metagenome]|uniref:Uncharacterized protein n=1 Tax=metagenome TaxID=256318 RepID=A0A2P2C7L0_9ZZZZ